MGLKLQKFARGGRGGKGGQHMMWLQLLSFAFGIYSDDPRCIIRVVFFKVVTVNY